MARARDSVTGRFMVAPGTTPAPVRGPVKKPGSRRRSRLILMLCRAVEQVRGVCTQVDETIIESIADIQVVLDRALAQPDSTGVPLSAPQLEQFTRGQYIIHKKMRLLGLKPPLLAAPAPPLAQRALSEVLAEANKL